MESFVTKIRTNLAGALQMTKMIDGIMMTGDNAANIILVELSRNGTRVRIEQGTHIIGYFIRSDGYTAEVDGEVTEDGDAKVIIPRSAYNVPGNLSIAVRMISGNTKVVIASANCFVNITETDSIIDPDHKIPDVQDLLQYIDQLDALKEAMEETEDEVTLAEGARVLAEQTRVSNETARQTAESGRVSAESSRVSNETARQTAENGRASAESTRVSNETARQTDESERTSAEQTRVSNETARQTAEAARILAEQGRVSNETTRQIDESGRANAESTRVSNETARQTAESGRASAESTRVSNETARQTAESGRANAESTRVSNETARQTAEAARVTADAARTAATNTAIAKIDNMTVAASQNPAGSNPTATISEVSGHKHIAFGIPKGDPGKDFRIKKTFISIAQMEAYSGSDIEENDFAMIDTGNVQDPDTGKLYCYEPSNTPKWRYIGDLSGAQGIKGETGTGIASVQLNQDYTLTITMTDGSSVTTTSIRGQTGATGETGNGIASVVLNNDYTLTITYTDGTSVTTSSIRGETGATGATGATGNGIASINVNADYSLTINMTNGTSVTTDSLRGPKGDPGTNSFTCSYDSVEDTINVLLR